MDTQTYTLQRLHWLGIAISVPSEWEIVRHAVDRRNGRLVLVDRRHQRMVLTWVPCDREPDMARMFSDSRSRDQDMPDAHGFTALPSSSGWRGYRWREKQRQVCRAGRYDAAGKRWIEAVIIWPSSRDADLERDILSSCEIARGGPDMRRVSAFGLDVVYPEGWDLNAAVVRAGDVRFRCSRNTYAVEVSRVSVLEGWYDGDLAQYARACLDGTGASVSAGTRNGHDSQLATGREKGFSARWLVGRRQHRAVQVWQCEQSHALYGVSAHAYRRDAAEPVGEFAVHCCADTKERV